MSLWRRLFKRDPAPQPVSRQLSLKEQYQRKVNLYTEMVTASNAALEIMARMQARLQGHDYFSPALVQLHCALIVGHTRRVLNLLLRFAHGLPSDLLDLADRLEAHLNQEIALTLKRESSLLALPFEKQTLSEPQLWASGVAYQAKEQDSPDALIIKAVWGWWPAVQKGTVAVKRYRVVQGRVSEFTSPETGPQERWLTYHPEQGFFMEPLPDHLHGQPCLTAEEAGIIANYYHALSMHYPNPQEVEWALGPNREVIILRSLDYGRPSTPDVPGPETLPRLLFSQGVNIYPGLASGPAVRIDVDRMPDDLNIPEGAVLFANKPALSLAPLLPKTAALVVETGEPHNHLAFLARDRRLPTIFDVGEDTSQVSEDMIVSVDARRLQVSAGPLATPATEQEEDSSQPLLAEKMLTRLSPWLFPLNTAVPDKPLAPQACQSIHDLLYYASEVRRNEMFCLSLKAEVDKKDAVSLVTGRLVPILIIDGGGGLSAATPSVGFDEVASIPFRAFLDGMMSIPWPKARPLDVKGFISVIGVTSTTPRADDQLRKTSFALLSQDYMNFSLCLGYHASTIEAYVGDNLDNNYLRFHYQGGAASLERRWRRLQLIGEILARLGFKVTVEGDLLDAIVIGDPEPQLLRKLEVVGRLEVYTKQMDMVMSDDATVLGYVTDFLEKHCYSD